MSQSRSWDIKEIYEQFDSSVSTNVVIEFKSDNSKQVFRNCFHRRNSEGANNFAFVVSSENIALEFYDTQDGGAAVFFYDHTESEPKFVGNMQYGSAMEGDIVQHFFENDDLEVMIQLKILLLETDKLEKYSSSKGDALGLKWKCLRNTFEQMKWDMINRYVILSIYDKNNEQIDRWGVCQLVSINIGGPEEFYLELSDASEGDLRHARIFPLDENNEKPSGEYQKLSLGYESVTQSGRSVQLLDFSLRYNADKDAKSYLFATDDQKVMIVIKRNEYLKEMAKKYELFTAVPHYI